MPRHRQRLGLRLVRQPIEPFLGRAFLIGINEFRRYSSSLLWLSRHAGNQSLVGIFEIRCTSIDAREMATVFQGSMPSRPGTAERI
jgi:hypothetical protein